MKNYINAYKDLIVVLHKTVKFNENCIHLMKKQILALEKSSTISDSKT